MRAYSKIFLDTDTCNCNTGGSSSLSCNSIGVCTCKDNVNGEKCNECTTGFVGFPDCINEYEKDREGELLKFQKFY